MTDKELIKTLQYLGRVTKDYDQEQMVGADYEMIPTITKQAADRIEDLVKEVDRRIEPEQVEDLIKLAEPIMTELYGVECSYREAAEAKLAKAVEALLELVTCVDDGCNCSEIRMATVMDKASAVLAEVEKPE